MNQLFRVAMTFLVLTSAAQAETSSESQVVASIKAALQSRVSGEARVEEVSPSYSSQLIKFIQTAKSKKYSRVEKETLLYRAIMNARVQINAQTGGAGLDHWYLTSVLERITTAVNQGNYTAAANTAEAAGGWIAEILN